MIQNSKLKREVYSLYNGGKGSISPCNLWRVTGFRCEGKNSFYNSILVLTKEYFSDCIFCATKGMVDGERSLILTPCRKFRPVSLSDL
jgi:hypothetical protein